MENKLTIRQKLLNIQSNLKAPKGQFNSFGNYKYRSCEDILEAVKPLCKEQGVVLILHDNIIQVGDRYYVQAVASLEDVETLEALTCTAFAREEESKKGMDSSQVTGACSSYARKYALNGLLMIDDTKDEDTDELHNQKTARAKYEPKPQAQAKPEPKAEVKTPDTQKAEIIKQLKTFKYSEKGLVGNYNKKFGTSFTFFEEMPFESLVWIYDQCAGAKETGNV